MDEKYEELAALNALGMLESDEKRVLTGAGLADKDLRDLSVELEAVAAELGHLLTPQEPPPDLKRRIRTKIQSRGGALMSISPSTMLCLAGWVIAAGLGVALSFVWKDRARLSQDLAAASKLITPVASVQDHSGEVRNLESSLKKLHDDHEKKQASLKAELETARKSEADARAKADQLIADEAARKKRDAELTMRVVTIQSDVWEYRRSLMTVIWDGSRQQGVLLLDKMPQVEPGKDYQLWLVSTQKPVPISAGIITVDEKGGARANFKPGQDVGGDVKFLLSIEKKGRAEKQESEVVLKEK